jgi:nitroreductase
MKRLFFFHWALGSILAGWFANALPCLARDLQPISLPPPQMTGGKPLMQPEDKERLATIDAGYISQNIYLFCASAGLATVVHETDRTGLREALHLKPGQKIIIAQSVGYPKATPAGGGSAR